MQDLNVPVAIPRTAGRQENRANVPAASLTEYYRRAVFISLLNCVVSDISNRFTEGTFNTLSELARFIPSHIVVNDIQADTDINSDNYHDYVRLVPDYRVCASGQIHASCRD